MPAVAAKVRGSLWIVVPGTVVFAAGCNGLLGNSEHTLQFDAGEDSAMDAGINAPSLRDGGIDANDGGPPGSNDADATSDGDATAREDAGDAAVGDGAAKDADDDADGGGGDGGPTCSEAGCCTQPRCAMTVLVSGQQQPIAVAVTSAGVYWINQANYDSPCLVGALLDGGDVRTLGSSGRLSALVANASDVYWTDSSTDDAVYFSSVGGGGTQTFAEDQGGPVGIAIDSANVYWSDSANAADDAGIGNAVLRRPFDGGPAVVLAAGQGNPFGIAVDPLYVYWTNDEDDGGIVKIGIDGGGLTTLASNRSGPEWLAVSAANVYWSEEGTSGLWMMPTGGGTPTPLFPNANLTLAATENGAVYFQNAEGAIVRYLEDGGTVTTLATGFANPGGIAFDSTSLYWTNYGNASDSSGVILRLTPR